ncbi:Tn3 family transposase [Streptomyces malaysiensis subsp. malaysiensis]
MFVLCLRILQSALVYVNTLMLQDILGEPEWTNLLTPADRRGLTPLFWSHLRPYGEVNLDMDIRLKLTAVTVPGPRAPDSQAAQPPWKTHDLHRYSAAGSRAGVLGAWHYPPSLGLPAWWHRLWLRTPFRPVIRGSAVALQETPVESADLAG